MASDSNILYICIVFFSFLGLTNFIKFEDKTEKTII